MPSLTERLTLIIDAKTGGAVKEFDKVAKSTDELEAKSTRTGKALQSMGLSGKLSGDALKAGLVTGVAAAGAAVAGFAISSVKHFQDTALSVRNFQRVTGQSAEESSQFVAALDDMGISAEQGSASIFKLSKNIATGGKALTDLGIGIEHTASGTTDLKETFLNIADAVAKTPDPAKRAEIAFAAFGKQGAALLPILEKGSKAIEEMFANSDLAFSQDQLDNAENFRLALDHLGDSVGRVQNAIGGALAPALASGADSLASVIDSAESATESIGGISGVVKGLGGVFQLATGNVDDAIGTFGRLIRGTDDSKLSTEELAGAEEALGYATGALTGKTKDQVVALAEQTDALRELYSATLAQFDAEIGYKEAVNGVEDAVSATAEKQKELTEAIKNHGASSAEAKAATEALSRAQLDEEQALLRAAQAAARVAEETATLNGVTDSTVPKIDAQIATLRGLAAQASGPTQKAISELVARLEGIKSEYHTEVVVKTGGAETRLGGLQRLLGNLTGQTHQIPVTVTGAPLPKTGPSNTQSLIPKFHDGGVFHTSNPSGEGLAILKNNETVLAPGERAGGVATTVNIYMPQGSDGEDVVNALKRYERRNGTGWRN